MHVPADTAVAETPSVPACGGAVPRQFGSIVVPLSKRTSTPFEPAARILASRPGVSHPALGCGSVLTSPELAAASAAPGPAPRTNASSTPAPTNSFLMCLPLRFRLRSAQRMTFRARPCHHAMDACALRGARESPLTGVTPVAGVRRDLQGDHTGAGKRGGGG